MVRNIEARKREFEQKMSLKETEKTADELTLKIATALTPLLREVVRDEIQPLREMQLLHMQAAYAALPSEMQGRYLTKLKELGMPVSEASATLNIPESTAYVRVKSVKGE